jgi:hypothetical protein
MFKGIDWDKITHNDKKELLDKFESIKVRQLNFSKPVLIIHNPNSGKKVDLIPKILERLNSKGINFELMPTE